MAKRNDPERRCIVSREVIGRNGLIRFALGPDDTVLPDLAEKLGGRGAWVSATREGVESATRSGAFARAFKARVTLSEGLADMCEQGLAQRSLALLGFAKRSGELALGYDMARALVKTAEPAYIVEASDGAADGRRKVWGLARQLWNGRPKLIGCFTSEELGKAVGRDQLMHLVLPRSGVTKRLDTELTRLAGFRNLVPEDWLGEGG